MKRRFLWLIILVLMMSLAACGKEQTAGEGNNVSGDLAEEESPEHSYAARKPVSCADFTSKIIRLGEYKGLSVVRTVVEITDEDVEREIREIKKQYGQLTEVDRPAEMGDVVLIDYIGYVDGETIEALQGTGDELELGSGRFVPGFEEQLVGVQSGTECEINLTFPEDYYEEVAGKDVRFQVKVECISSYEVENWESGFIRENLQYEDEVQLRASIREELEHSAEADADAALEYELVKALLAGSEFDVQQPDVEAYIDEIVSEYEMYAAIYQMSLEEYLKSFQMTEEQLRDLCRESADFRVRMVLALQAVASEEELEVTEEECQVKVHELAEEYGYSDPAAVEAVYSREVLKEQMRQERALTFIVENAVIS